MDPTEMDIGITPGPGPLMVDNDKLRKAVRSGLFPAMLRHNEPVLFFHHVGKVLCTGPASLVGEQEVVTRRQLAADGHEFVRREGDITIESVPFKYVIMQTAEPMEGFDPLMLAYTGVLGGHWAGCIYYVCQDMEQLRAFVDNKCAKCGESCGKKYRCSRCLEVWYCGRACQKAHWRVHKPSCVPRPVAFKGQDVEIAKAAEQL